MEARLVGRKGAVSLSINKKYEGNKLAADYAFLVLKIEGLTVIERGDKRIAASPILSLDRRLGTLIVIYRQDHFHLESKIDLMVDTN